MLLLLLPYKTKTRLKIQYSTCVLQMASFRDMLSLLMSLVVRVACCKRDYTKTTFGNNSRRFHVIRQNCSLGEGGVASNGGAKCAS